MQQRPINIAILTYNALEWTKVCVDSIRKNTKTPYRIFILDNLSKDETRDWLKELTGDDVVVELGTENLGVPGGRNRLVQMISPHLPNDGWIVFLDNDMELRPGWDLTFLSFFAEHPEVGIASAWGHRMSVYQQKRELWQHSEYTAPVDVACGGFCCWVRAATVRKLPTFDTALGLFWHEDDDYTVRALHAGFEAYALPHAPLIHHEHRSGVATPTIKVGGSPKNQEYLTKKWRSLGAVIDRGLVGRPERSVADLAPVRITDRITAHGASRDQGGYRWLQRRSLFEVDCPSDAGSNRSLKLNLALAKPEWYPSLPQEVKLFVDQELFTEAQLTSEVQSSTIIVPLKPGQRTKISVICSSVFSPLLAGFGPIMTEPIGLILQGIEITADQPSGSRAQGNRVTCPPLEPTRRGAHVFGNFCTGDDASLLTRHLVRSLEGASIPVRLIPLEIDIRLAQAPGILATPAQWISATTADVACDWAIIVAVPGQFGNVLGWLRERCAKARRTILVLAGERRFFSQEEQAAFALFSDIWTVTDENSSSAGSIAAPISFDLVEGRPELALAANSQAIITMSVGGSDLRALTYAFAAYLHGFRRRTDTVFVVFWEEGGEVFPPNYLEEVAASTGIPESERPLFMVADAEVRVFHRVEMLSGSRLVLVSQDRPAAHLLKLELSSRRLPWMGVSSGPGWIDPAEFSDSMKQVAAMMQRLIFDQQFSAQVVDSCFSRVREKYSAAAMCMRMRQLLEVESKRDPVRETTIIVRNESVPAPRNIMVNEREIIEIDARCLTYPEAYERGIGHYTYHHLKAVMRMRPEVQFELATLDDERSRFLDSLCSEPNAIRVTGLRERVRRPSLFHIPDPISLITGYDSPFLLAPDHVPSSVVFFDLIPLLLRETYLDSAGSGMKRAYFLRLEEVQRSHAHLLAISENTQNDLMKHLKIQSSRIVNISAGYNQPEGNCTFSEAAFAKVAERLGIRDPFFLSVGGLDPHKDFATTMNAFVALQARYPLQFVVVGSLSDPYKQIFREKLNAMGVRSVVFAGYIPREELVQLYGAALGLVYPSMYEGFGFPVLEAMANRCPVITTDVSSLPEVIGSAGVLVKSGNSQSVVDAMLRLVKDSNFVATLREKGYERAKLFTWENVAKRTWAVWDKLMQNRNASHVAPETEHPHEPLGNRSSTPRSGGVIVRAH